MERNYLSLPPPPPAIRAAMVKVAERLDKKLPLYDFSSGNVGRLPSKIKLFKEFKIDINNDVHESLLSIAEGLAEGIIESFYSELKGLSYSPTGGLPYIKRLVLQYFKEIHGIPLSNEDINKVTVTAGGQQALISSLRSLKKNTRLLMLRWDYDATPSIAKSHGLIEVRININEDLTIDLSDLENKVTRDSVFYLSMPNNPTGYTSPKDLKNIVKIIAENNGGVIWDAPYIFTILRLSNNKAIYDESFLIENLKNFKEIASKYYEYMCILSSLSKTCLIAGLRFGMAFSCEEWINNMEAIIGMESLSSPTPSFIIGSAILKRFLNNPISHKWTCNILANRLTILIEELGDYLLLPRNGAFGALYVIVKTPMDGKKFSSMLIDNYGIVTIPGEAFYGETVNAIRLSLVSLPWTEEDQEWIKNVKELKKAITNIK